MIIKSKSTGNAGNLIKYILRPEKQVTVRSFSRFIDRLKERDALGKPTYVAGRLLSKSDIRNLMSEHDDLLLQTALRNYKGSREEFILNRLMVPGPLADLYRPVEKPLVFTRNLRSNDIEGYIREFAASTANRVYKSRDMVDAQHVMLSWHATDAAKLTDAKLRAMAKEFMRLHGEDKIYLIVKHSDKAHTHLHCAVSGTTLDGRSARVSKADFASIKREMTLFQERNFPELSNSLPEHGKKQKMLENQNIKKIDRNNVRTPLLQCLDEVYSKSTSMTHFLAQLREKGIEPYERAGVMTGVVADGYKFRFSRLGYDIDRLQELDVKKTRADATLKEFASIRTRGREMQKGKEIIVDAPTGALKEMADIRNAATEKEIARTVEDIHDQPQSFPDREPTVDDTIKETEPEQHQTDVSETDLEWKDE